MMLARGFSLFGDFWEQFYYFSLSNWWWGAEGPFWEGFRWSSALAASRAFSDFSNGFF